MTRISHAGLVARGLRPVVLVDDCEDALFLSSRALRKAGLRNPLVTLKGGEAAVAYLRGTCLAAGGRRCRRPELVFLDIKMPGFDGFRVLEWLRRRRAFRRLPVVMLTTSEDPIDVERAMELGAAGVLAKFPTPQTLASVLSARLRVALFAAGKADRRRSRNRE